MTSGTVLLLLGAGLAAGLSGSMAGLASLFSYPALLAVGLPPTAANVTNTVALAFSTAGAAAGSRPELAGQGVTVRRLALISIPGGAAGAGLLLLTPPGTFELIVPVLVAAASAVLLAQPWIRRAADRRRDRPARRPRPASALPDPDGAAPDDTRQDVGAAGRSTATTAATTTAATTRAATAVQDRGWPGRGVLVGVFVVSVYGGYFGAAAGVLMLALVLVGLPVSLLQGNALKTVLLGLANVIAAIGFAVFGPVAWWAVPPMAVGLLVGAWCGPWVARRLPPTALRTGIALAGLGLAVSLALQSWT
ncbi:MAG TPA: sulfite exporter TauE/SafE family protein [Pseudonocardia sp.]|nr:sulfite exporter TauE/SafE family protein [Pseudonocardia sp.]